MVGGVVSEYSIGTYATIKVENGPSTSWPVVERVAGGWQSGEHHYPDATVTRVRPLPLATELSDATRTDEIDLDVATARLDDAERALDNLRTISDGLPADDYCEDVGDALGAMGVVLAELRRRRAQVDALIAGLIEPRGLELNPNVVFERTPGDDGSGR